MAWPDWTRIVVTGDRYWASMALVDREVLRLKKKHGKNLIVIGGGAQGLDTMMRISCEKNDVHFAEVKALWNTRYKSAGPQRNTAMLALCPHEYVAFHKDISKSKGTRDMIEQCKKASVPGRLVSR